MADVFVRHNGGSDSNGGTSKTDAFLTLGKANTSSANNDRIVIGAGTYRETVSLSHTGQTWLGDVDGVLTGDAGDLLWSAYTTNDKTAPSGSPVVNLNAKTGHAFTDILFIGGSSASAACVAEASGVATAPVFTRCGFLGPFGNGALCDIAVTGGGVGPVYDRCWAVGGIGGVGIWRLGLALRASTDYDAGAKYLNCVLLVLSSLSSANGIHHYQNGGSSTFKGGGGLVSGCTIYSANNAVLVGNTNVSAVYPIKVVGNYLYGAQTGLNDNSSRGAIVEDFNVVEASAYNSSGGSWKGANSIGNRTYAPLLEAWQNFVTGRALRPFGQPMASSPLLGFVPKGTAIAVGLPATLADDATVGSITWTTPANAAYPDATYTTCVVTASATGHYLTATNLGFALPSTATVTRIFARFIGHTSGSGTPAANSIKLIKGGTIGGTDNSASLTAFNTGSDFCYEVGGASDLWGQTWLYSDINASNFGVAVSWKNTHVSNSETFSVDYLTVAVEYTDSSVPTEQAQDFTSGPRPAGNQGGSVNLAVGAFERGSTAVKETGTVQAGSTSGKLLGPSCQDFSLTVDATPTTVSVYLYYDASYGGSTLPTLGVLNGTECGVATASASQVGADNTWEQVSLAFTPTSKGVVTIRVSNLSTAAAGATYFDTFGVA